MRLYLVIGDIEGRVKLSDEFLDLIQTIVDGRLEGSSEILQSLDVDGFVVDF